jgi:hypothetical protein
LSRAVWYWLILFLMVVVGAWGNWPAAPNGWRPFGWMLPLLILLTLIGWALFGSPVK